MDNTEFENKKIKCAWCVNFGSSYCSAKKHSVKARKSRRCESFTPNEEALKKEAERGKDTPVIKRPEYYWMNRKERKAFIMKKQQELEAALKGHATHPLTGDLSQFKTTAD